MEKDEELITNITVAMSGGVDSSVAAALLVEKGFSVTGVMLQTWADGTTPGMNGIAQERACEIANQLQIPFQVVNVTSEFKKQVINYFIESHSNGVTPNPCYVCNRSIKWGLLLDYALRSGADKLASGHYAQLKRGENGNYLLYRAMDKTKDQSYVLAALQQSQLRYAMFPLGKYSKKEIRDVAHSYNFPIKEEEESQDLCFLEGSSQEDFLRRYAPELFSPGVITTEEGDVIGKHEGLALYTIGQRKGIQISHREPYYILSKDVQTNSLVVGTRSALGKRQIRVTNVNWISGEEPPLPSQFQIKVRYRADAVEGLITRDRSSSYNITFKELVRDPTPGQYAVFYDGDMVVGSGVISGVPAGVNS
ncbi:MAG TPA: tRNA 2-thiouridine(34) synthase MnmA [Anaerolineaceae bacterium]|nr:tRNA 2-thiouridine(34) synthase MnmA [Anaerolineaceae bacterium]